MLNATLTDDELQGADPGGAGVLIDLGGGAPGFDIGTGQQIPADPLKPFASEAMAAELLRRHPELGQQPAPAQQPAAPGAQPGAGDQRQADPGALVQEVTARLGGIQGILDEARKIDGLEPGDIAQLQRVLGSGQFSAADLANPNVRDTILGRAKGVAYDRKFGQPPGGPAQQPAPVTPGGVAPRDGLTREELARITELAPRLNVSVEDLKKQYIERKKEPA